MPTPSRVVLPRRRLDPMRALARRLALAFGVMLLVALLTYLGRAGYRDAAGGELTVLDALYYASVTVTTTGYGDITPISPTARAVTAFVVTPARILFLIILVGTTLELLTERFRESWAVSRWRDRVEDHIVVAGYGTKGRGAVASIIDGGTATVDDIVVIDRDPGLLEEARALGLVTVVGDATRTTVLDQAGIGTARAVVVCAHSDDTATLIALTARELNARATIVAAVREEENAHLLKQSGADSVIVSSEASGRMLGMATEHPKAIAVLEDLIVAGQGLELLERPASADEVGGPPQPLGGTLPIALVRGRTRVPFDSAAFQDVQAGDVVVSLATR